MALGAALSACFNPPADAVLFACDAKTAPSCPAGYSCEVDDCCHRDGSDIDAALGSCRIGGGMSATSGSPTTSGGPTTSSGSETSGGSETSSGSETSGTATSASSGADTGSSDASATT